jgi:hypothetical protein
LFSHVLVGGNTSSLESALTQVPHVLYNQVGGKAYVTHQGKASGIDPTLTNVPYVHQVNKKRLLIVTSNVSELIFTSNAGVPR